MGRFAGTATTALMAQDTQLSVRNKVMPASRRVRTLLWQAAIWLDNWGLRGYPHDTHDWASKIERLRSLKNTTRQVQCREPVQEGNRSLS